jgi:rhomboid-like protein
VPSFREQIARASPVQSFADAVKHPVIGKHIIFVLGASSLVYVVAAHNTNVETKIWTSYLVSQRRWSTAAPTTGDMRLAQSQIILKKFQAQLTALTESLADAPIIAKSVILHSYARLAEMYLNASEGRRVGYSIAAVNVGIWVAWQIPVLRPFMMSHFTHHPLSGKTYTMLTSMFSHSSFLHLLFNCMALTSFGVFNFVRPQDEADRVVSPASATSTWMTREQVHAGSHLRESTATYHFLALYLSSGLFSSLASHLVVTRTVYPRLVSKLVQRGEQGSSGVIQKLSSSLSSAAKRPATDATAVTPTILPSLGASGAIYSTVIISTLAFPEAEVSLVFPPTPSFPIQYGVGGLVLLDCIGILRGWRFFDHYAHLGGAAFGALYYMYGMRAWDAMRVHALKSEAPTRKV